MTKPDFRQWAYNITIRTDMTQRTIDLIEQGLKDAFKQGYELGLNNGWAIEQDKDNANKETI